MINRVSVYIKSIYVEEGPVSIYKKGKGSHNMDMNTRLPYRYHILAATLSPGDKIDFIAAGKVHVNTITLDIETGSFYDLGASFETDRLYSIKVRQFLTGKLTGFDKDPKAEGFVLADLEY